MKVRELIQHLQQCNPESEVQVYEWDGQESSVPLKAVDESGKTSSVLLWSGWHDTPTHRKTD